MATPCPLRKLTVPKVASAGIAVLDVSIRGAASESQRRLQNDRDRIVDRRTRRIRPPSRMKNILNARLQRPPRRQLRLVGKFDYRLVVRFRQAHRLERLPEVVAHL